VDFLRERLLSRFALLLFFDFHFLNPFFYFLLLLFIEI
jgi:hypothetical protein